MGAVREAPYGRVVLSSEIQSRLPSSAGVALLVSQARDHAARRAREGDPRAPQGGYALRVRKGTVLPPHLGRGGLSSRSAEEPRGFRGQGSGDREEGFARGAGACTDLR